MAGRPPTLGHSIFCVRAPEHGLACRLARGPGLRKQRTPRANRGGGGRKREREGRRRGGEGAAVGGHPVRGRPAARTGPVGSPCPPTRGLLHSRAPPGRRAACEAGTWVGGHPVGGSTPSGAPSGTPAHFGRPSARQWPAILNQPVDRPAKATLIPLTPTGTGGCYTTPPYTLRTCV